MNEVKCTIISAKMKFTYYTPKNINYYTLQS